MNSLGTLTPTFTPMPLSPCFWHHVGLDAATTSAHAHTRIHKHPHAPTHKHVRTHPHRQCRRGVGVVSCRCSGGKAVQTQRSVGKE